MKSKYDLDSLWKKMPLLHKWLIDNNIEMNAKAISNVIPASDTIIKKWAQGESPSYSKLRKIAFTTNIPVDDLYIHNNISIPFGKRLDLVFERLGLDIGLIALKHNAHEKDWRSLSSISEINKELGWIGQDYPVNMTYLLYGYGDPILENHPKFEMHFKKDSNDDVLNDAGVGYKRTTPIPFFDVEVFGTVAESLSDAIPIHPDGYLEIPFFKRADFVVPVSGQSMKGKYNHGDWIAVRRIRNKDYIIYGEAYMVVTKSDNYRTVKFLKEDKDDPDNLVLIPYNIEQFDPQTIPKAEIRELFIVVGVVRPS